MLIVRTEDSNDRNQEVRRVVLFGYMETRDANTLCAAITGAPGAAVRLVALRIWRCERACVEALVASARDVRSAGASFSWVLPAPELRHELAERGELSFVVPPDPVDEWLTRGWE